MIERDSEITDLVQFYERWPDLRGRMTRLRDGSGLNPSERDLLGWMIRVVDRVGPDDLHDGQSAPDRRH